MKQWVIVISKLSRPPGNLDPPGSDYLGTTVMNLPVDRYLYGPGPSVQIWAWLMYDKSHIHPVMQMQFVRSGIRMSATQIDHVAALNSLLFDSVKLLNPTGFCSDNTQ
jgi:hypothetical protein